MLGWEVYCAFKCKAILFFHPFVNLEENLAEEITLFYALFCHTEASLLKITFASNPISLREPCSAEQAHLIDLISIP